MASAELASTAQEEEAATRDTPCQNPDTAVEAGGSTFEPSRSVALTLISTEAGGFHVSCLSDIEQRARDVPSPPLGDQDSCSGGFENLVQML